MYIHPLWEDINSHENDVPIPFAHKKELDRRLLRYKANPDTLLTLDQLKERVKERQ